MYVQEFSEELRNGLVAYINVDAAVLGTSIRR